MPARKPPHNRWLRRPSLMGLAAQITAAINTSANGAYVTLDLTTAKGAVEVCRTLEDLLDRMATAIAQPDSYEHRG